MFSDYNLMDKNIAEITNGDVLAFRVSKEHYLWLASGHGLVDTVARVAGGLVEGHPTSRINVLQRIRELLRKEELLREATVLLAKIDHTVSVHGKMDADTALHKSIDSALEVLDPHGSALSDMTKNRKSK